LVKFARFEKFANITDRLKTHDHATAFMGKARVPKWTPNPAWKAPELRIQRVAIDNNIDKDRLPEAQGVRVILGRARGEQMDLLVVGTMGYVRELGPGPSQQVCDLIFLVGRGMPLIGASTWRAVGGDPEKLTSTQVVYHKAASELNKVVFRYKGDFRMDNPEVMRALDKCAELPKSKWKVQLDKSKPGTPMAAPPVTQNLLRLQVWHLWAIGS